MKTAIAVGGPASGQPREFARLAAFAVEAEKLGVDSAWSAEAWGYDAVSILAYLAAKTERLVLGSGILQISARAPAMTAMTAMALAALSGNRFILGLGASGPQVVEGLHGVPFAKPLARMRETIEIVRLAFRGEPLRYAGEHHVLPLPGGEGKALRLAQPANPNIPIYLATLSPKALELTGELADGWLGTSFTPEAAEAHLAHLRRGAERAGRTLADLTLCVGCTFAVTDDPEPLLAAQKPRMAFTLGAMGSAKTNFYNDAYRRGGFEDAASRSAAAVARGQARGGRAPRARRDDPAHHADRPRVADPRAPARLSRRRHRRHAHRAARRRRRRAPRRARPRGGARPPGIVSRAAFHFAGFVVSRARRQLLRDGCELPLIPRYFDLLLLLIERRHEAVHRRELLDRVWSDVVVSDNALNQRWTRGRSWRLTAQRTAPRAAARAARALRPRIATLPLELDLARASRKREWVGRARLPDAAGRKFEPLSDG